MGYSPWGRKESDTTEHSCTRYVLGAIGEVLYCFVLLFSPIIFISWRLITIL